MTIIREAITRKRAAKCKPSDQELRRLPDRRALVYGRVSSPGQVRDSEESIREIAGLVDLAKLDGYVTGLDSRTVEAWLAHIQAGDIPPGMLEDSDIILDCRDLGISGTFGHDKRLGLANTKALLERRQLGAIYLSEPSRLSRDQDKVEPYALLRLMKDGNCKVRTPEGILSPCIERDWDILDEEFEDAREELRVWRRRLHRKKLRKAERGEYVGGSVCTGFYLPIVERRKDGRYRFGKIAPYEPHARVVNRVLRELVRRRSPFETMRALKGVTFPFFPPELAYMEGRTALRPCPWTPDGYAVTVDLLYGLAQNFALVGVWVYGDIVIESNHEAIVPEDLFWQAYEIVTSDKPKGRAIHYDPLPFDGLLWCGNHVELQHISARNSNGTYLCANEYRRGEEDRICLHITHRAIDIPLMSEVLSQLDFTPYADEVLAKLEAEAAEGKLEQARRKRQKTELQAMMANLRANLGRTQNSELVSEYERQILEVKEQLASLSIERIHGNVAAKPDIHAVREFLTNLRRNWDSYPATLRNRLLRLLIEMVVLKHDRERIEATVIWKAGFQQQIVIQRPPARGSREHRWTDEENTLLKMLWPSCSKEVLEAAFPSRKWSAIKNRAQYLRLKRVGQKTQLGGRRCRWLPEEEAKAEALYEAGAPLPDMVAELGRSRGAILNRAAEKRWHRPPSAKWKRSEVTWEVQDFKLSQAEPCAT